MPSKYLISNAITIIIISIALYKTVGWFYTRLNFLSFALCYVVSCMLHTSCCTWQWPTRKPNLLWSLCTFYLWWFISCCYLCDLVWESYFTFKLNFFTCYASSASSWVLLVTKKKPRIICWILCICFNTFSNLCNTRLELSIEIEYNVFNCEEK